MSGLVRKYLEHLPEMVEADLEGDLLQVRMDLLRALGEARFTIEERRLVLALVKYINAGDVPPPERDGSTGRPKGVRNLLNALAMPLLTTSMRSENARAAEASRRVSAVCERIAAYLGTGYEDQQVD